MKPEDYSDEQVKAALDAFSGRGVFGGEEQMRAAFVAASVPAQPECNWPKIAADQRERLGELRATVKSMRGLCDERTAQVAKVEHEKLEMGKRIAELEAQVKQDDDWVAKSGKALVDVLCDQEVQTLREASEFSTRDAETDTTKAWRLISALYFIVQRRLDWRSAPKPPETVEDVLSEMREHEWTACGAYLDRLEAARAREAVNHG